MDTMTDALLPTKCFPNNFFNKFFEKRDKYRFLIKKKVVGKNTVMRNLSSSVIKKFNGYENIKLKIARKEKTDFTPLEIR